MIFLYIGIALIVIAIISFIAMEILNNIAFKRGSTNNEFVRSFDDFLGYTAITSFWFGIVIVLVIAKTSVF